MRGFLYGQTEYNMLSNANRLDDYISMAKRCSFTFLSITDSNLYGHYKFYTKCIKEGIKPIIGLEVSFKTEDNNYSKAIIYAKNNNGYKSLLKISSYVKLHELEKIEEIKQYDDGISVIFIFNDSYIERAISCKDFNLLAEYFNRILIFADSYVGISYNNKLNNGAHIKIMESYAADNNINILPVHQCKYLDPNDSRVYEALCAIGGKEHKLSIYEDYSFYKNPDDDKRLDEFISSINLTLFNEKINLPKYPNTKGVNSKSFLEALCYKGLAKRGVSNPIYSERLKYELSIIDKMGYNDYFLIVWDFIKYSKQNNILVGPGRGSAAGSLVAYTLGITEVDPIKYDLLFERFLNPERVSMPDIDTDFPDIYRDQVINHVKDTYGKTHICNISAFGTFLVKSSIRDLARIKKMDNSRVERIIEMVEKYGFQDLLQRYSDEDELYEFLYIASKIEGLPRHISTHAAGIILSDKALDEIIPLQEGINGLYQSQLEASDLEKIGLLKMDFLGIRNLTMVQSMMDDIEGFSMQSLREIPLNDKKTFELFQRADTLGIFQLESTGIRNVLRKLKPTSFEDIVAVLALYRPGPMDNIDEYISRKHGNKFTYIHPALEPILKSTYGIIIYQEQIMKIAQVFAGYTLGEADVLRRAVSKKDADLLKSLEEDFIKKSKDMGFQEQIAKAIYDLIYKFANYGFNRSHSVAYSLLSYQMAYFKANYFNVFMANILNNVIGNTPTLVNYLKYAMSYNLKTYKPNINISTNRFVNTKLGLFMPLNSIYSIGDAVSSVIIEERAKNGQFKNYDDFRNRCSSLSSSTLEALIYSGALDIFGIPKKQMLKKMTNEDDIYFRNMNNVIVDNSEFEFDFLREKELKYIGINLEYNLFSNLADEYKRCRAISLNMIKANTLNRILVQIVDYKEINTKKNEKMMVGEFIDANLKYKFTIFPSVYQALNVKFDKNIIYLVLAKLEKNHKNEDVLIVEKIAPIH